MSNRRRGAGIRLFIVILVVVLVLLGGVGMLFDINEILVEGAYEYTAEEIIEVSGIEKGGNLFFFNSSAAENRIIEAFPYVSFVMISREIPGTVRISVSEGIACAAVEFEGVLYLLDENCRVISKAEDDDTYIKIVGLEVLDIKRGSVVEVSKDDETRLYFTQSILNRLGDDGYSAYVTWLDVSNIGNITFDYKGRFTVKIGSGEKLEYKLSRLEGIVSQLDSEAVGVIDISEEGKVFFDPS